MDFASHASRRTIAKDEKLLALACSNLAQKRQQVVRDPLGVFAHDTTWVRAAGVEVSEQSTVPLLERLVGLLQLVPLGIDAVPDDILNHRLGASVGVGRTGRAILGDGNHVGESGSVAVNGSR